MFEPSRVVHRNLILATGVSGPEITELVALGVLTRLWRGWYTTGDPLGLPDPRGVTRSMRVVLSHESAAAWCGVDIAGPVDRLHVTAPRNRGRRSDSAPRVRIHRAPLHAGEIQLVRGVRVTRPARTVADIARGSGLKDGVVVADGYLRRRLVTVAELKSYAASLAGPRRTTAIQVAALADPKAGSAFESLTRVLLLEAGLPRPRTQFVVRTLEGAWIGRVDFAWPQCRLVLECDGFEYHASHAAFVRDRRRWSALTRAGWRVVVVSWMDIAERPDYVTDLISACLAGPEVAHKVQVARVS